MKMQLKLPLILASLSPRRRHLMKKAGIEFKIVPSDVKETHSWLRPSSLVKFLALKKAVSVSRKHPGSLVLGADTVVYVGGKIIGKPKSERDAEEILRRQSGRWQRVFTGVALVWDGGRSRKSGVSVSRVKMRVLAAADIDWAIRHHLDKAGAYAVQQKDDPFIEQIIGDYDNVVGLPMRVVRKLLKPFTGRRASL